MFGWIKIWYRKQRFNAESKRVEEIFQLKEHDNQIWLTVNGGLVCPTTMLKEDAVIAINMMRVMYMDRLFGKENKDDE
jgi:hypothetical protein